MVEVLHPSRVAIVIAAGGQGQRMGGDKPARKLAGRSMLERAIDAAQTWGDTIAIAVREPGQAANSNLPVLLDSAENLGPISALASAFRFAIRQHCSHVLLVACDMPFLPRDLLPRLAAAIGDKGAALPVSEGHLQAMAGLWRVAPDQLAAFIAQGGRSLRRFAEVQEATEIQWPADGSGNAFEDIDDLAQLRDAEVRLNIAGQTACSP